MAPKRLGIPRWGAAYHLGRIKPGRTSFFLSYPHKLNSCFCAPDIGARCSSHGKPVTPKPAIVWCFLAIRGKIFSTNMKSHSPNVFSSMAREKAPATRSANCNPATFAAGAVSGIDVERLRRSPEGNVAGLIVAWYSAHLAAGGDRDAVADDLIAEARIEGAVSHKPGRA